MRATGIPIPLLDNHLSEIETNFDYVNSGGCACVAVMLAKALRHVFPIMRITSCGNDEPINLDELRLTLSDPLNKWEWHYAGIGFHHVWVEIFTHGYWYALDSTGVKPIKAMYKRWDEPAKGSYTIEEMESMASDTDWNKMFDRDQLPAIQELITNNLSNL